jgi:hypothetical protein
MYFEYNFMNIDAVILMPDSNTIEMTREKNLTSDNSIKMTVSFEVQTYYPSFRRDRVNSVGYPRTSGSGMSDANGFSLSGGVSNFFNQPGGTAPTSANGVPNPYDYIGGQNPGQNPDTSGSGGINPQFGSVGGFENASGSGAPNGGYGSTGSFYNTQASINPSDPYGTFADQFTPTPKRTRWFNNILRSRERSSGNTPNPNGQDPNTSNDGNVSNT